MAPGLSVRTGSRLEATRRAENFDVSRETLTPKPVVSLHVGSTLRRLRTMCATGPAASLPGRMRRVVRPITHPFGRRGMASDDALAQGQGRKRWFGGRGPTRATEQSPEGDMAPVQPSIPETSVQTEG